MKTMKRLLAIVLALTMVLSLAACGNRETLVDLSDIIGNQTGTADDTVQPTVQDTKVENTTVSYGNESAAPTVEAQSTVSGSTTVQKPVVNATVEQSDSTNKEIVVNDETPAVHENPSLNTAPKGEYNEGVVLVKFEDEYDEAAFGTLAFTSVKELYEGSKWYAVELKDVTTTVDAVKYLTELDTFDKVDYDYVMGVDGPKEDAQNNPNYDKQVNLGLSNIPNGWTHNGKAPGGSPDVVIAVIDTGVDYNHLDLRNNIWTNTAEIANNGKDDDGNGYIDDVYGWDCVGDDKDPMDDNGHGTHVAGIIAAENNKLGGIGVAYNCKVMVLKAGNSSGYFNNSDIAEAIQYAYMNGASVINMSFGGSNISIAVEDALENAYHSCVLVAAAGNDGACNNLDCGTCDIVKVSYPAALPYVIGVMSTDKDGKHISSFSNYDHNPYDSIEYEVYAVGEGVGSTWPSNKYACLNGTSMAAPTVAGIAALLRSNYTDREKYSTKFIQSQIVNTGTVNPHILDHVTDEAHSVADVVEALTKLPKPAVNLYDYYIDDSASINSKNNGNGVVDAGETVRLYISLHNRGGVATDVNVSIDTYRSEVGDETMTDPYFTFKNTTMQLSDIGTYSVRESGDKYFEIVVDADCPNDYLADFNIRYTYKNGMDEKDTNNYSGDGKAQFNVSRGYHLPATITEDTIYKADRLYIVGENVTIPQGVTVTFEEGCEIQFYDDRAYYRSPRITVNGTLNISGTKKHMVSIYPNEQHSTFLCIIQVNNGGSAFLNYADCLNLYIDDANYYNQGNSNGMSGTNSEILNSYLKSNSNTRSYGEYSLYLDGAISQSNGALIRVATITSSYVDVDHGNVWAATIDSSFFIIDAKNVTIYVKNYGLDGYNWKASGEFTNNIVYTSFNERAQHISNQKADRILNLDAAHIVTNNMFLSLNNNDVYTFLKISGNVSSTPIFTDNTFDEYFYTYADQLINGYYDSSGMPMVDIYTECNDLSALYPHIVDIVIQDKNSEAITTVGKEEVKVHVTFNRPMDTTKDTFLTFGTIEPYADYRINGTWVSDTVWEGTYALKAQIENGQNFLKVNNACAAEDQTKTVFGEYQLHEFTIDTTEAMAMNLQAFPQEDGILLNFAQDDYDTLLGYNVYRSEEKDGNYVKLNPAILLPTDSTFLDENAEPGKSYWYTYTVVLTDFSESTPAGKVMATAMDTMAPSMYHTPVNQGYENNNLVISATASDNVGIDKVTLYYRTVGTEIWKSLSMTKVNDKYSATIFGSDVTLAGLEYYIVATDGRNQVVKGSAEVPYTVVVKSVDALLGMGDVDGNGSVTAKDALMLMQCLGGELILTDDQFHRADLNGDEVLSAAEALRILQYVNGKVTTLEM